MQDLSCSSRRIGSIGIPLNFLANFSFGRTFEHYSVIIYLLHEWKDEKQTEVAWMTLSPSYWTKMVILLSRISISVTVAVVQWEVQLIQSLINCQNAANLQPPPQANPWWQDCTMKVGHDYPTELEGPEFGY